MAEMVDVGVKNDLVRAHVVALKDGCESVVLRVEALVAPVGVDRSSSGRESATRAADSARGVRAGGRTRTRKPRCLAVVISGAFKFFLLHHHIINIKFFFPRRSKRQRNF
jgi:hypothetical protein